MELAHTGKTPAQLSREFGPTSQTIINWIAQDARDRGTPLPGKEGLSTQERQELARLRRKLREVRAGAGHLGKGLRLFAARHNKTFMPSTNS